MANKEQELVFTRVFDAPRELVFKAWTSPKQVAQWWGPRGFSNPVCELDLRPGGAIRIHMRRPDGTVYPMTGVYHEIVEPERLVFTSAALGGDGSPMFEVLTTVTFAEQNGKTKQTAGARYKDDGPGRPVYCWNGAGLDSEPGAPCRIPRKDLTVEEGKMSGCLPNGGCSNPDKASQDRAVGGRETERRFA